MRSLCLFFGIEASKTRLLRLVPILDGMPAIAQTIQERLQKIVLDNGVQRMSVGMRHLHHGA